MFTSVSSKLMMTAMAASSLLKLLRPGTTMLSRSSWSDWEELPAASSLLDTCNKPRDVNTPRRASRRTFLPRSGSLNAGQQDVEINVVVVTLTLLLVCGETCGHFSCVGPKGLEAPLDEEEFIL
ncbi:hypothetical protein EYF80_044627 [Liparis tanakae]|uniref:Uncharacterized protein n=1 Tax=Liparis tanakae TaxID=230148 RepID=A0A4Z2FV85_9TELE|nr:hypothetical protein EYF80_044627 [Liparis tanakae]